MTIRQAVIEILFIVLPTLCIVALNRGGNWMGKR